MRSVYTHDAYDMFPVLYVLARGTTWLYRVVGETLQAKGIAIAARGTEPAFGAAAIEMLWEHGEDAVPALGLTHPHCLEPQSWLRHPPYPLGRGLVELEVRHREGITKLHAEPSVLEPRDYVLATAPELLPLPVSGRIVFDARP